MLGTAPLKNAEIEVDGKIRTASLAIIAATCLCFAVYKLKAVLVPFVIAVALKFLLTPIINFLSCAECSTPGNCKLPRGLAIVFSFLVVIWGGSLIVTLVTASATTFMSKSDVYTERLTELLDRGFEAVNNVSISLGREPSSLEAVEAELEKFVANVSISDMILHVLGSVGHIAENALYIILFLAFLLHNEDHGEEKGDDKLANTAEASVHRYIRGKVTISLGVATLSAAIYFFLGVEVAAGLELTASTHRPASDPLEFDPHSAAALACLRPPLLLAQLQ